jgi:intracellular sulfur oxidation DsrE/DsrF family protein
MTDISNPVARRAFVTGFGVGAAALSTGLAACASAKETPKPAMGAATALARWQPAFDAKDGWMEVPSRHRMAFDATSDQGAANAIGFADTFIGTNASGYGIEPSELGVIVILRHYATPYAYTDPVWAKYGHVFAKVDKLKDPKAKKGPAMRNVLEAADVKTMFNDGVTFSALAKKNVRYAVCGEATKKIAGMIAKKMTLDAKTVEAELAAHLIPSAHLMASGILALNRVQEHGYAFAYVG